jgi:hypothetical protein
MNLEIKKVIDYGKGKGVVGLEVGNRLYESRLIQTALYSARMNAVRSR